MDIKRIQSLFSSDLFKALGKIILIYLAFSFLCIFIFQDSEISQRYFGLSPKLSSSVLDTIMFIGFALFVRAMMCSYGNITGKKTKRAILYWDIFTAILTILIVLYWAITIVVLNSSVQ